MVYFDPTSTKLVQQFINLAIGKDRATIGHDMNSCTRDVEPVRCTDLDNPGRNVVFLDTPGFDDSKMTDTQVLAAIAHWLKMT